MLKFPNAIVTGLLLQRSFSSRVSDLSASPHLRVSSKDYLVTSLSLSSQCIEDLKIIKQKPKSIKSTSNADSVIALFTDYGFSHTQLAKIFSLCPSLLTFNPHNNLKPKLDFLLTQTGISGDTLIHALTNNPKILQRSLRRQIAPSIDFLNTFFNNNHQTLNSFLLHNRATHMLLSFSENTPANVETLRLHGVLDSSIHRLFLLGGGPTCLAQETEYFSKNLKEIMDMGFDLSSAMFPRVFRGYCGMSKEKWVSKMKLLKDCFGLTRDQQVLALFVKQPTFMTLSLENLQKSLEFYMKRLGWTPNYIAKYPGLLAYSLETRILPRSSVLEILKSKGLVKKVSIPSAYKMSEDTFLSMFVNKYQKDLPNIQLMEIYTKSMPNSEFGGSI